MKFRKFKRTMLLIEKVVQALILPGWLLLMIWWFYEAVVAKEESPVVFLGIPLCLIASAIIGGSLIGISKAITLIISWLGGLNSKMTTNIRKAVTCSILGPGDN